MGQTLTLTPASRFMMDSIKSPNKLLKNTRVPSPAAAKGVAGHAVTFQSPKATATLAAKPPTAPSTVFLGLMSVSLVRPSALPATQTEDGAL